MSNKQTTIDSTVTLDSDNATVKAVVAQVKSDMRGTAKYAKYVEEFGVTRDNVGEHGKAIARLVTPETAQTKTDDNGTKVRTRFGNAVQAATKGLRAALGSDDSDKPATDWLRLVRQAAENAANKGEISADQILDAVAEALGMTPWDLDAAYGTEETPAA